MSGANDLQATAQTLSAVSYFAGLERDTMNAIAQSAIRRTYQADQIVFLAGRPSTSLCVVEDGWLKAVKTSRQGREQVLRFVGPGEVVNEVGVFAGGRNPATVVALPPTTMRRCIVNVGPLRRRWPPGGVGRRRRLRGDSAPSCSFSTPRWAS